MSYAVRNDRQGFRAVETEDDCTAEEFYSETEPVIVETAQDILNGFVREIQKRLDSFARTRNYDGILSACTYATSLIPKFKAEGQYAVEARDNTWATAYELLAEVEAGTRPMPTLDEVIAALPELVWPQ